MMYVIKELKSNLKKHLQSSTHNEMDKCMRVKHTIENLIFFDTDELFNEYITNHNRKLDLYLIKYDFESVFGQDFYPHDEYEFR